MGLTAAETGGDFELTPQGQYTARCYRVIDLGTQTSTWQGKEKQSHKVLISWELIGKNDEHMKEGDNKGKPFSIHQRYTVSLSENARLRQDLESWRGRKFTPEELKGFDLKHVLGAYGTVQVMHSEDGKFANVDIIMAYKGDKPEQVNPDLVFDIDEPDMQIFETLSDNIKGTIMQAPEWNPNKQKPEPSEVAKKKDVVIEDTGQEIVLDDLEGDKVNLEDIPF